jgi:hypothetical protein
MHPFLNGLSAAGSLIAFTLFLRFWRDTREQLFLWFALAFVMFAVNWTAISVLHPSDEASYLHYVPRLCGFLLILAGIIDKNRQRPQSGP